MARSRVGRAIGWTVGGVVVGAVIGGGAFVALRHYAPRYTSSVLYQVRSNEEVFSRTPAVSVSRCGGDDLGTYIDTQTALILSDRLLERVAKEPEVLATDWAKGHKTTDAMIEGLRVAIDVESTPGTGLFGFDVWASNPDDAKTLASIIDDVYRRNDLTVSTSDAQKLIEDLDRKVREHRSDIAAFDIRIAHVLKEHGLTGTSIEQTTPYHERDALVGRLTDVRAQLAALPPAEENEDAEAQAARRSLESVRANLDARVKELNETLVEHTEAITEIGNLRTERARKLEQIDYFEAIIGDLSVIMDQGSRIRVVTEPRTPETISSPQLMPTLRATILVFGVLGLALGILRP